MTLHQFRGRVVLLNFWFVDCPNCILEMPGLNTVYNEFRSQGFRFLAVDELGSSAAEAEAIAEFLELNPAYQFPILLDQNFQVTTLYGFTGAPWNLLIDKTGVIRRHEQSVTEDDLRSWVQELINE